ncbi:DUF72 domain-containing protein [Amycolatopsis magusensis]|uniref:Uncharacterized protein YecE (DUF72 family) n=1 Tax=Amycolatopsis magusensis TaxID=882444 RepID=A0ABS4PJQ9_9PSEU|nr:DUF72 domain-containing protein [Amycolatopsis magusensis]MBP2179078.1 uncharacterized protein YecE (DUF72 family) [Amycolatopsis magusensis]
MTADIRIGTSGWRYGPWRGKFYPKGLVQRRELEYLSHRFNTAELNGSFYSLQRPERYRTWFTETPDDFVFAVKGGRFITHMKQLRDVRTPLANFFASGVLALGHKLGPFLWQLPPRLAFDAERLTEFFDQLPRTTRAAAALAKEHDDKLKGEAHTSPGRNRTLRHALEVRHPSFESDEAVELLRKHKIGLVVADSAGNWPLMEDVTADFVYVRLHGDEELYASGYSEKVLKQWATKVRAWHRKDLDVYVYFDNDIKVKAPGDATHLGDLLGLDLTTPEQATD